MPQSRDAGGRFIKKTVAASTPTPNINPEFEKPILSVTVTNPLKKILYWLNEIRRKQTTTFAVKLSIPLIALPVIIFAAFSVGRKSAILPFINNQASPTPTVSASPSPVPYSRSGTLKIAKGANQTKYVLALKNGENVLLEIPANIELTKYQNKLVLVTGYYNRQANAIKVLEIAEIEVFNETIIPSPSPSPSPTPESTKSAN